MKKLYVFAIVTVFSFVFIGSEANDSSLKINSKSNCPYLNQIQQEHGANGCPYTEHQGELNGSACPYHNNMQKGSKDKCPYLNGKNEKVNVTHVMNFIGT